MIDYLEIKDQQHQMYAEGISVDKPTILDIDTAIFLEGFIASNISYMFDNLQKIWRFTATVEKNKRK